MPLFLTFGAIRNTWPPDGVVMAPSLRTLPANAPALNLLRPSRKSASAMFSVDAVNPATSMREPCPNMTPFGLIRKTLPFDCSAPRIWLGSWPTMRLSTALFAPCCTKRVTSPGAIEKVCQLMIVFGVFVIVNTLPCWWKVAVPLTTTGAVGAATAAEKTPARSKGRSLFMISPISRQSPSGHEHGHCR